jgi:hypothetical protein
MRSPSTTRAWVAKIEGRSKKYVLKREFLPSSVYGRDPEMPYGWRNYPLPGPGLYEYRCFGADASLTGFFRVTVKVFRRRVELVDNDTAYRSVGVPPLLVLIGG